jgi:hypothetical protein
MGLEKFGRWLSVRVTTFRNAREILRMALAGKTGLIPLVWHDQWQEFLAILALATTLFTQELPPLLIALYVICVVAILRRAYVSTRAALKRLREKHVPVVVLVGKGTDAADAMWNDVCRTMKADPWDFDEAQYLRDFRLDRGRFFMHLEDSLRADDPQSWLRATLKFRNRIETLSSELTGRRVFHVFINGPIALGFGLGASLGTMHEVVVHQYFPAGGSLPYSPVGDFYKLSFDNQRGMHQLEDKVVGKLTYVEEIPPVGNSPELCASIWMAKDDPLEQVNAFALARSAAIQRPVDVLHIRQIKQQTLEKSDDWILCAREILTLLFRHIPGREQVHLFISMPVALAFIVGMGLEHFADVKLYSWFPKQGYSPVIPLAHLGRAYVE